MFLDLNWVLLNWYLPCYLFDMTKLNVKLESNKEINIWVITFLELNMYMPKNLQSFYS